MYFYHNKAIKKKYNWQALLLYVSIWISLAGLLLWLTIPYFFGSLTYNHLLCSLISLFGLAYLPFLFKDFRNRQEKQLLEQLNQHPQMEYSTQLLFKDATTVNGLQQLQLHKIEARLQQVLKKMKAQHFIGKAIACFLFNLVLVLLVTQFVLKADVSNVADQINEADFITPSVSASKPLEITQLEKHHVKITPPPYTHIQTSTTQKMSLKVPEGSELSWHLQFNKKISKLQMEFSNKTIPFLTADSLHYKLSSKPTEQIFYNIISDSLVNGKVLHKLYSVDLIPDQKPVPKIINLKNYSIIKHNQIQAQSIRFILNDDYGIAQASLQITKSSGKGEGVQFEQKVYDINNLKRQIEQSISIDLNELKPTPGDEFFIRLQVLDNKPDEPQLSFSDTYIIGIEDTIKQQAEFEMALGMDVEPEYFRSQRQIIIDTEALIEKQSEMSISSYKDESNNLGIEQKLLRLRYGKFLGEEFEGQIGVRKGEQEVDVLKEEEVIQNYDNEEVHSSKENEHDKQEHYEHDHTTEEHDHDEDCTHDHEEEHLHDHGEAHENQADHEHQADHNHEHHGHDHGTTNDNPEAPKNWLAPFTHFHDNAESNTFFESEVKAKLKAALAQMWDAELQLRLAQPKLSLPYQYQALQLIKEVQQASRIYVERVGLELPEIDVVKKRLTAELDEVINPHNKIQIKEKELYSNLELVIRIIQNLYDEQEKSQLPQSLKKIKQLLTPLQHENVFTYAQCMHIVQQSHNSPNKLNELQLILNDYIEINWQISGKTVHKNSRLENLYWENLNN